MKDSIWLALRVSTKTTSRDPKDVSLYPSYKPSAGRLSGIFLSPNFAFSVRLRNSGLPAYSALDAS